MEVTSQSRESEGGADKSADCQPPCISSQPAANGTLPHRQAPPPASEPVIDSSPINGVLCAPPAAAAAVSCEAPPSAPMAPPLPPCEQLDSNQKTLSSARSHASSKTNADANGDECCAECLLACLYCELPSLCVELWAWVACDGGCEALAACCACCCCGGGGEGAGEAACAQEACQAAMDCGIMEDCCSSADCLEFCLECCSLCSPAS